MASLRKKVSLRSAPEHRLGQRLRWWGTAAVLILAMGLAVSFWLRPRAPRPPTISTAGLDLAIAALIDKSVAEVRSSPRSGPAWGRLGMVLQTYDFKEDARSCFVEAERLSPQEPRWPWFHALLLLPDDAGLPKLRRAVELCHDQPDAPRLKLAQLLAERGELDEAERHFQELLRARPDHAVAWLGVANVSISHGRLEESVGQLNRCLTNEYTAKAACQLLATVQQRLGHTNAADTATRLAATLPPDRDWPNPFAQEAAQYRVGRQALLDRAQQLLRQRRAEEALPVATRLVTDYADAADAWLTLGRVRVLEKDFVAAEQALRHCLQLDPKLVDGHMQLGLALLYQRRNAEAAASFQEALRQKPALAEAHYNLGLARLREGDRAGAIQSLREAIRCDANEVQPRLALADALNKSGQREEALAELRRALKLNPNDARVRQMLERTMRSQ
jgi:tetratricopeptide (TPR) repeat protein